MKFMKFIGACIFLTFLPHAAFSAGSTINEDFSLVRSMCEDMISLAKQKDQDHFVEMADAALKLTEAQRRDNSMSIDRFRPKIRFAKKAAKAGDFDKAIILLEEALPLMKAASSTWDGGS